MCTGDTAPGRTTWVRGGLLAPRAPRVHSRSEIPSHRRLGTQGHHKQSMQCQGTLASPRWHCCVCLGLGDLCLWGVPTPSHKGTPGVSTSRLGRRSACFPQELESYLTPWQGWTAVSPSFHAGQGWVPCLRIGPKEALPTPSGCALRIPGWLPA